MKTIESIDLFLSVKTGNVVLAQQMPIREDRDRATYLLKSPKTYYDAIIFTSPKSEDRATSAKREFNARIALAHTELAPYIPQPIEVSDVGVLVEHRQGQLLNQRKEQFYSVDRPTYYSFETALLSLQDRSSLPRHDMLSLNNIGYEDQAGFWFAMAALGKYESIQAYRQAVARFSVSMKPLATRT